MASVTITDVAKRAGVSMKTVSRVMNAEPHVSEALRERVSAAARDLRYRPRISARSLAGARSYVVGFVLNSEQLRQEPAPYVIQAQLGALAACRAAGYHLLVEAIDTAAADLRAEIEGLSRALAVDGLILLPPLCDNTALLTELEAADVGYVRIAPVTEPDRSARVEADDVGAARAMTEHLLGLGHRRIGVVTGPKAHGASQRRLEGYRRAMAEAGAAVEEALIHPGEFTFQSGYDAAAALLAASDPPSAIFASNDVMAFGVMAKAHAVGRRIPDDLSVAGFDDVPAAGMVWPQLTTMRQPISEMAGIAASLIIDGSRGGGDAGRQKHPRALDCELVVRGSTAPPPGAPSGPRPAGG